MKNNTSRNLFIGSSLTLIMALALVIWSPVLSQSAEPTGGMTMMETPMMKCCQDMKAQIDKMWKDLKAQDTALTEQVAEMNGAPQDKKVSLMAAVITRMVEQRTSTNVRMEKMQDKIMQHMMQHIQKGEGSMLPHPMMMGMNDMGHNPGDAQKEQR